VLGGHAYVINGIDIDKKLFRIKNSWGQRWGKNGFAFISFTDMEKLIRENGEICIAAENEF
jgi:C1A family cysteine protease